MNKSALWAFLGFVVVIAVLLFVGIHKSDESKALQNASSIAQTSQASSSPAGVTTSVKAYFVAIGDNGKTGPLIGCGDSIVPVQVAINPTQTPLHDALTILLSDKRHGVTTGLYNVFSNSNLVLANATIVNGVATITLTGTLSLGGECDDPRVVAELDSTALQFPSVKSVVVTLNGKPLESVIGGKGE